MTALDDSPRSNGLAEIGRRSPLALIALGVVLYATGPVFVGSAEVSGPVLSFWRLWFGVAVFGVATVVHTRTSGRRADLEGWKWAARAGFVFGIHQLCFMSAVKLTSVVDTTLMSTLSPIVVGVLAVPMFGERPGLPFRAWSAVAIAGAAVVALAGSSGPGGDPIGMLLAFVNVVFFALFFVWSKHTRDHIDVVPFLFGVMVVAASTVTCYVVVSGEPVGSARGHDFAMAACMALGPGALGHFVMTWPLRWVPANVPPIMRLAGPAISGALAYAILHQEITVAHLVGGSVTIAGVAGALLSPAGRALTRDAAEAAELD